MFLTNLYYNLRPFVPRALQIAIRRQIVRQRRTQYAHVWPIDERAGAAPEGWTGWPDGKKFAFVITHDVETAKGVERCEQLAQVDREYGFRSSFNFVAEGYRIPEGLRASLERDGFEVGVHGLVHRGNLYESRKKFETDAKKINQYLKEWNSCGFRTPSMYHNLEWLEDLHIEYDSSTFDTDPFEPQPDALGTIFPKWISSNGPGAGFVELPYTLPQDYMLFVVMKETSIDIWKRKLDWIAERGGLALLLTHPDYISLDNSPTYQEFSVDYYKQFLAYVRDRYAGQYWAVTPRDLTRYWVQKHVERKKAALPSKRVVEIDPSQDERWDKFVESHPYGWICHLSGWKKVIESSFGHMKGHYLAVVDETGELRAGLPLFEVRSWLTGKRLVSVPFATLCDPLTGSEDETRMLFDAAIGLSEQVDIPKMEIRSLHSQDLFVGPRMHKECLFQHHYLALTDDIKSLKMSFDNSCRKEINRAQNNGLMLCIADTEEQLRVFYVLHTKTRGRLGLPPQPYRFLQALWNMFLPLGMVTLLLAKHDNEYIAGQLYFKFRGRASMEFEAWDRDKRHFVPNHFLIWEAIKLFQAEGYDKLDFGRTAISNAPLMLFKGRWGTQVVDLPSFVYPADERGMQGDRDNSLSYRTVKWACKLAPQWALYPIGEFCYRHLG